MNSVLSATSPSEIDHLAEYIGGVRTLSKKFGIIAENQRDSANSLSRAVAALHSMAALNDAKHRPGSRNTPPANENIASVK